MLLLFSVANKKNNLFKTLGEHLPGFGKTIRFIFLIAFVSMFLFFMPATLRAEEPGQLGSGWATWHVKSYTRLGNVKGEVERKRMLRYHVVLYQLPVFTMTDGYKYTRSQWR